MPQSYKPCPYCDNMMHANSERCRSCRAAYANTVREVKAIERKQLQYNTKKPANSVNIRDIDRNGVEIVAYQKNAVATIRYYRDSVLSAIERISNGISSITFDPMVYDSRQDTKSITIDKNTVVEWIDKENNT